MPKLIVLCGITHAGKSTYAQMIVEKDSSYVVISSDSIRLALTGSSAPNGAEDQVWAKFAELKAKALKENENIILDACHMSRGSRWHSVQNVSSNYTKEIVIFNPSLEIIEERMRKTKRVPLDLAKSMLNYFDVPEKDELQEFGFDDILYRKR